MTILDGINLKKNLVSIIFKKNLKKKFQKFVF